MSSKGSVLTMLLWLALGQASAEAVVEYSAVRRTHAFADQSFHKWTFSGEGDVDPHAHSSVLGAYSRATQTSSLVGDHFGFTLVGAGAAKVERFHNLGSQVGVYAFSSVEIAFAPGREATFSLEMLRLNSTGPGPINEVRLQKIGGPTLFSFAGDLSVSEIEGRLAAGDQYRFTVSTRVDLTVDLEGALAGTFDIQFSVREVPRPPKRQIEIRNAGFESPAAGGASLDVTPDHWEQVQGMGGVWNINQFSLGRWDAPAPQGDQVLTVMGVPDGGIPGIFRQELDEIVEPDTLYRLTGNAGGTFSSQYLVSLYAGPYLIASIVGQAPLRQFEEFLIGVDTRRIPVDAIGEPLTIELRGNVGRTSFDDLRLEALLIPEPATWSIMFGLIGLTGMSRRRR